jgi:subfamily B ATP-binding cassette protein MsbA
MKLYLRILHYAPNLTPRLVQFFIYALFATLFSASYMVMVIPMIDAIFNSPIVTEVPPLPAFEFTTEFAKGFFQHYNQRIIASYGPQGALVFVGVAIICQVLIANTFRYMERMTASRIKVDVTKNLRVHFFRNVSSLHIGYFNSQRKGDLMSRFTNDVHEVENSVFNSMKSVMKEPITIIVYLTILFVMSYKLTLFILLLLPITGGVIGQLIKKLKKKAKQSQEAVGRIVNILDETFSGMRVINAFNARNFIIEKIDKETTHHRKVNLSIARKNELSAPLSEFLGVIIVSIILLYGGNLVMEGDMKPAVFIGYLAIYASLIQPAKNFSNGITSVQKGTIAAGRIFNIIDTEPAIKNKPDAIVVDGFHDSIEFKNVSFAYERDLILKNINLKIGKGKTVALVGPSGGGKSTLADLVPRFYDPTQGEVCLDGKSLTDYDIESLRGLMGVVTQESILFNDTIFNNIAFGMPHVSEADVIEAAKVANAHHFIMQTENGYQTMIGERGSKLSGGQRQRLAIARAVLKNPPILILDEATSALDSESEKLVQEALTNLMKNRTSVVIAHRLSTIQHADEIVVIQDGHILERGNHETLIRQDGLYRKLNEIQKT